MKNFKSKNKNYLIKFFDEMIYKITTLHESPKGWNGRETKYDIRDWVSNHEQMGKGFTLSNEELDKLKEALKSL